jgi:trans-aconitate 2-methyltransferase
VAIGERSEVAEPIAVWDPAQYLRFADERLRPALDLLARVPLDQPARVVDFGCGPGTVTAILRRRFARADIVGIDSSAAMLETARAAVPRCSFEQADFFDWQPHEPVDLIYSNAALQWVDRHPQLFARLLSFLTPVGVLAVQMPDMHDEPLRQIPFELAVTERWSACFRDIAPARRILTPIAYWDLLRPLVAALDVWQTTYMHALAGQDAVMEWASGSSLREFLDRLPAERRDEFRQAYSDAAKRHYPLRADGTTLLAFRRLFIVARGGSRAVTSTGAPLSGLALG